MNQNHVNQPHQMIRNAHIDVSTVDVGKRTSKPQVTITVNNDKQHTFATSSRISKAMLVMSEEDLGKRLSGGSYFFVGDHLIDFRDRHYNGFEHSDQAIDKLMEVIGTKDSTYRERRAFGSNTTLSTTMLANRWKSDNFQIKAYQEGGAFTSNLSYVWNPFHQHVRGVFELVRQICTNGMVGTTDFFQSRIPVINRWEEHLEIAARQIQNRVNDQVTVRLEQMGKQRASVSELNLIADHAENRLIDLRAMDFAERADFEKAAMMLRNIFFAAKPSIHLAGYYKPAVFENSSLAAQMSGHLSLFDAWNMVTEMNSHSDESELSTGAALQRLANSMVFDKGNQFARHNMKNNAIRQPLLSSFSDPRTAFFGQIVTH